MLYEVITLLAKAGAGPPPAQAGGGRSAQAASSEIREARARVNKVKLPDKVANPAIQLVQKLGVDSLRAEITWFEAARAHAAADGRDEVSPDA